MLQISLIFVFVHCESKKGSTLTMAITLPILVTAVIRVTPFFDSQCTCSLKKNAFLKFFWSVMDDHDDFNV